MNVLYPLRGDYTAAVRFLSGSCNDCGQWMEALDNHRRCGMCHRKRDDALEELAEIAGMYCERLPAEVAEALHAIPHQDKQHSHNVPELETEQDLI